LVQIPTVCTVPNGNISADLSRYKLGKSAHTCHSLSGCESVNEVLSKVSLNRLQVLDLVFFHEYPDHCKV
jgi:hypothetical protein